MATVKICGIQDNATLQSILDLPIDHIGFVFAKSRRQVSLEQAAEMATLLRSARGLRSTPLAVGVFVNPGLTELRETLEKVPLDAVQLHGQETPDFCREVKRSFAVRLFKVVPVQSAQRSPADCRRQLEGYRGTVDAILLDTFDPIAGGGTGKAFAWETIPLYAEWTRSNNVPLIVAGGLHPGNVGELLRSYRPDGVDVSSGVETDGVKDVLKIASFVERVKKHDIGA
jgi:phosphoribosylanthranilate isomerase